MWSSSKTRAQAISHLLDTPLVSSLLATHPNDLTVPAWSWAAISPSSRALWTDLVRYYTRVDDDDDDDDDLEINSIPIDLRNLINDIRRLQLPRDPLHVISVPLDRPSIAGMSPKKIHEVVRMAAYIAHLRDTNPYLRHVRHVVDVGAGQAHLSRVLSIQLGFNVLAIDSNGVQTKGAQRWDGKAKKRQERRRDTHLPTGTLTHRTIRITADNIHTAIDEWIREESACPLNKHDQPIPVLIVALHGCGSLTPDILRYFVARNRPDHHTNPVTWMPVGLVAVGCCYNLMSTHDFPLSRYVSSLSPSPRLSLSALHLATQIPAQWLSTPSSTASATLAIRKVAWRALFQRYLPLHLSKNHDMNTDGTGKNAINTRLGRLADSEYNDWKTFIRVAASRLHPNDNPAAAPENSKIYQPQAECAGAQPLRSDEEPLEILHVLRCLLGPLVESVIVLDRLLWLGEALGDGLETRFDVDAVNLFDQATGSGRNIAIVVVPRKLE